MDAPNLRVISPLNLFWYDNPEKPDDIDKWNLPPLPTGVKGATLHEEGVMFIGDKGMLCTNYGYRALLPEDQFKNFTPPLKTLGDPSSHQGNWVDACLKNDPSAAVAPFSYGALLCEVPMLSTIAFRVGKQLEWDPYNMKFPNAREAEKYLDYPHREGWTLWNAAIIVARTLRPQHEAPRHASRLYFLRQDRHRSELGRTVKLTS